VVVVFPLSRTVVLVASTPQPLTQDVMVAKEVDVNVEMVLRIVGVGDVTGVTNTVLNAETVLVLADVDVVVAAVSALSMLLMTPLITALTTLDGTLVGVGETYVVRVVVPDDSTIVDVTTGQGGNVNVVVNPPEIVTTLDDCPDTSWERRRRGRLKARRPMVIGDHLNVLLNDRGYVEERLWMD